MKNDEKFRVLTKSEKGIEKMYLHGFLDAHTAPLLESAIQNSIGNSKYKILMNFENLEYISSAGLGVFMSFIEEVRANNGDIKMAAMNDKVFSVFDLLGFPMLFDIHKDENVVYDIFLNSNTN